MATTNGQPASAQLKDDLVRTTVAHLKQLTVDRLKRVLKNEGLAVSGVKSELQRRLIQYVYTLDQRNDLERLQRMQNAVRGYYPDSSASSYALPPQPTNPYPSPYSNHTPASSASPSNFYHSPSNRTHPATSLPAMPGYGLLQNTSVLFKPSPFYKIKRQLGTSVEMKPRETTRDTARVTIDIDADLAQELQVNSLCRVYVFCAVSRYDAARNSVDIAFPGHSELKINNHEIRANLKGLKNKPGSTRPADITPFLGKKNSPRNVLEFVYALTKEDTSSQKFLLSVQVVDKKTIEMLVAELKAGKYLSKNRVLADLQNQADDDDVVATSSNMSLKDPVQMTRIETPCRSMACKHNECFDAAVYLALQEQAPTWTCPICNKPAPWEQLVFDQFFQDILNNTKSEVEQVSIEPDGKWHLIKEASPEMSKPKQAVKQSYQDDDDDDDLIEITEIEPPSAFRMPSNTTPTSSTAFAIPPTQPAGSSPIPVSGPVSKKRPRDESVIDLTLSDDDDEPPLSRIKRPSLASHSSDMSRPSLPLPAVPYRFNLPQPIHSRTESNSPANGYGPYDYDRQLTGRL